MAVHTISVEQNIDYFVYTINNIEDTHSITVLLPDSINCIKKTVDNLWIYFNGVQNSETTNAKNSFDFHFCKI